jgi:putative membrane protein
MILQLTTPVPQESASDYGDRMKILIRLAANAFAAWLTFELVDGLVWDEDWLTLGLIAILIGLVNAFIKPVAKAISLPIRFLTLGLFTLVINVALMAFVLWIGEAMEIGVSSDNWQSTLLGGLVLAIVSSVLSALVD